VGRKEYRETDAITSSIQHPAILSQLFTQIVGALDENKQVFINDLMKDIIL
jgi:hypothetical protein